MARTFPANLYGWLTSTDEGSLNLIDIAVLAVIVMALEQGTARSPAPISETAPS